MNGTVDRGVAHRIGFTDDLSPFDTATGKPHGEAAGGVVPTVPSLGTRSASEFAAPDNKGAVEQPALLEIGEQAGHRSIAARGAALVSAFEVLVGIPSIDLSDAVYFLAFLFQGGPMPHSCPSTGPTEDDCTNGVDDDLDGATDCVDSDCLP